VLAGPAVELAGTATIVAEGTIDPTWIGGQGRLAVAPIVADADESQR
jgi:hypothetical protein